MSGTIPARLGLARTLAFWALFAPNLVVCYLLGLIAINALEFHAWAEYWGDVLTITLLGAALILRLCGKQAAALVGVLAVTALNLWRI